MIARRLLLALAFICWRPFSAFADNESLPELVKGQIFILRRVAGASLVAHKTISDFEVYAVRIGSRANANLLVYEGTAPQFNPDKHSVTATLVNGREAAQCVWKTGKRWNREVAVQLPPPKGASVHFFVHFIYADLTPKERSVADSVIGTLEPLEPAN